MLAPTPRAAALAPSVTRACAGAGRSLVPARAVARAAQPVRLYAAAYVSLSPTPAFFLPTASALAANGRRRAPPVRRFGLLATAAAAGTIAALAYAAGPVNADSVGSPPPLFPRGGPRRATTLTAAQPSLKEQIFGHYENRIREMSSPEKIFEYFASVTKGSGKEKEYFMTASDFVRAITPYDFLPGADVGPDGSQHNENPFACTHVEEIIASVDQDADGLISFSEFIFFTTLLSIPPQYVGIAFRVFDEDGNGEVDVAEFKRLMGFLRANNPLAKAQRQYSEEVENAGVYPVFFGKDGKKKLGHEEFATFLHRLRQAVLHMQFDILTRSPDHAVNTIAATDFASSLISYANLRSGPGYLDRLEKLKANKYKISFKEYQDFNSVLDHLDEIDFAINSFLTTGDPFKPHHLKRAAKAVANVSLTDEIIDIVFFLFDKDGDGRLDYEEFVGVMQGRKDLGLTKPRDLGLARFVSCFKDCWSSEMSNRSSRGMR